MKKLKHIPILFLALFFEIQACSIKKEFVLSLEDSYQIPSDYISHNALFGGISGVDYDVKNKRFFLVSDDRSEKSPARYYIANIQIEGDKIKKVSIDDVRYFKNKLGHLYGKETADLESIRYHYRKDELLVGDEGGNFGNASIKKFKSDGTYLQDFKIDSSYLSKLRNNKSFESLSTGKNHRKIYFISESPLTSDGGEPSFETDGILKLVSANYNSGKIKKEWRYRLEKIDTNNVLRRKVNISKADNGLSEILRLDGYFLFLERSGAYLKNNTFNFNCKLYLGTPRKDVIDKKLLFDFSKVIGGDCNLEGMTLVDIKSHQKYLLLVSDNNFIANTPTTIFLLKIKKQHGK